MKKFVFSTIFFFLIGDTVSAKVRLSGLFTDNMVLQRNASIPVWGWAAPQETVKIQFHHQQKKVKADNNGKWTLNLDAEHAGGPYELVVTANDTIRIVNVLVGEVWILSGQSNMEFTVNRGDHAKEEIASANYPFIRHAKVITHINSLPEEDARIYGWNICSINTVGDFSAAGYFFAKRLYDSLKVPVGLINATWGGTQIETWISRQGFESSAAFSQMIAAMPLISIDSLYKLKIKATELRIETLMGTKFKELQPEKFMESGCNDAKWPEINIPQVWEVQRIGELDGVVWLRKTILLPASDFNTAAILELSKIDDMDITYVNGIKVGSTNQWDAKRKYILPAGTLKEGKNYIAVQVTDNGGGGGIYGDAADLKLTLNNSTYSLAGTWKFQVESIQKAVSENSFPSLCYNAMINPLIPFSCKGILWYQGESNIGRAYQYRTSFPLLINDWRKKWNKPGLPFYFVQIAPFNTGGNSNYGCAIAELREAQTMALDLPNTGMVVTTDIGNFLDIHPTNKQDVGKRLAAIALNNLYGKKMVCNGPVYETMKIKGSEVEITFNQMGSGLMTTSFTGELGGFEIAGNDQVFHSAKARISGNRVVLISDKVLSPVAVRYGWSPDTDKCTLFNREGFPAVPFRTDQWRTITIHEKYQIEQLIL